MTQPQMPFSGVTPREPVQVVGAAVITLAARTLESRVDWLIQQVATLTARTNALERRLAEASREDRA